MPPFRRHDGTRPLRQCRRGLSLRLGAKRVRSHRDRTLFTRRSVRGIFRHVQEVNCPKGARETTLGCAAAKNDPTSFRRRRRRKPGRGSPSWTCPLGDGRGRFAARRGRGSRSAACRYRGLLLAAWPRSGFGGGNAAGSFARRSLTRGPRCDRVAFDGKSFGSSLRHSPGASAACRASLPSDLTQQRKARAAYPPTWPLPVLGLLYLGGSGASAPANARGERE